MDNEPPKPPDTPFCGDLRSKRFLMLDTIPTEPDQYLDPSMHCWCYHTQQAIGPDGEFVGPEECRPGRSCYRSALATPEPWQPPTMPLEQTDGQSTPE